MVSLLTMANHFCNLQSGPTQHNIHQDIQSHDFQLTDDCIERFKAFDDALDRSIITESDNQPAAILRRPIRFDPTLPLLRFTLTPISVRWDTLVSRQNFAFKRMDIDHSEQLTQSVSSQNLKIGEQRDLIDRQHAEIQTLQTKNQRLVSQLTVKTKEINCLKDQNSNITRELKSTDEKLKSALIELETLKRQFEIKEADFDQQLKNLKKQLAAIIEENRSLKDRLAAANIEQDQLMKDFNKLIANNEWLYLSLDSKNSKHDTVIKELTAINQDLDDKNLAIQTELEGSQTTNQKLELANQELSKLIDKTTGEKIRLISKLEYVTDQFNSVATLLLQCAEDKLRNARNAELAYPPDEVARHRRAYERQRLVSMTNTLSNQNLSEKTTH